jgi:hypothetical protein
VSIYATLWHLQFPRHGDSYAGCEWIEVLAQGVRRVSGYGYESGDPFASFLPPALRIGDGVFEDDFRAVVFVTNLSKKGTSCAAIGPGWFWNCWTAMAARHSCSRTARPVQARQSRNQNVDGMHKCAYKKYVGRLCRFNPCPKHKPECRAARCGDVPFLQQHDDFAFDSTDSLRPDRIRVLFERR